MTRIADISEPKTLEHINKLYRNYEILQENIKFLPVKTIQDNYNVDINDYCVLCNNTSNITINLPSAKNLAGKEYIFVKISSNTYSVNIQAKTNEYINNLSSKLLTNQWQKVKIISNGTNWIILNE